MKKYLFLLLQLFLLAVPASADRAQGIPFSAVQPDGSRITLRLVGDESMHYFLTSDEKPALRGADGAFYYATLTDDGQNLIPSTTLVSENAAWSLDADFSQRLSRLAAQRRAPYAQGRIERAEKLRRQREAAATPDRPRRKPLTGKYRGLVILVNYSDVKMNSATANQDFNDLFNKPGYNRGTCIGSVSDYFRDQSYGKFDLEFDVLGPIELSRTQAYYGANNASGSDIRAYQMLVDAIATIGPANLDLSPYDWDGDREVEQVFLIYAGYSESSGGGEDCVWPHEWHLQYSPRGSKLAANGYLIDTYACGSELKGMSGTVMDGIGTAVHEFSHCLGIPDMYDTVGSSFGMNRWSVMDYGTYNGNSDIPAPYTAYERWQSGWLEPIELKDPFTVTEMPPLTDEPVAYVIYNQRNKNEYYLLENHQGRRWDIGAWGHGMLVLHVDYNALAWQQNQVNADPSHQRCTIVPADNIFSSNTISGDPYPGARYNHSLTDTSTPAATLFNTNSDGRRFLGKPIEDIQEKSNGNISFVFCGGSLLDAPVNLQAAPFGDALNITWDEVPDATDYTLEILDSRAAPAGEVVLFENFARCNNASDGATDISENLNNYTQQTGWTGLKVYESLQRVKLGTSRSEGFIISPLLPTPVKETITIQIDEEPYKNVSSATVSVRLISSAGTVMQEKSLVATGGTYTLTLPAPNQQYKVAIYADKRLYIGRIEVVDGEPTETPAEAPLTPCATVTTNGARTLVENLVLNQYILENPLHTVYKIRVRAFGHNMTPSDYSSALLVDLTDGLDGIAVPTLAPAASTPVQRYALDGRLLPTHAVPRGITLERDAQGHVTKRVRK